MSVAVVTGSNKGIGLAIVRALCKKFSGDVYLTSRDEGRGKEAIESLKKEGLHPKFHCLDICNEETVEKLDQEVPTTKISETDKPSEVNGKTIVAAEGKKKSCEEEFDIIKLPFGRRNVAAGVIGWATCRS